MTTPPFGQQRPSYNYSFEQHCQFLRATSKNGKWMFPCPLPGHGQGKGDRHPSAEIWEDSEGKRGAKCYAGCDNTQLYDKCIRTFIQKKHTTRRASKADQEKTLQLPRLGSGGPFLPTLIDPEDPTKTLDYKLTCPDCQQEVQSTMLTDSLNSWPALWCDCPDSTYDKLFKALVEVYKDVGIRFAVPYDGKEDRYHKPKPTWTVRLEPGKKSVGRESSKDTFLYRWGLETDNQYAQDNRDDDQRVYVVTEGEKAAAALYSAYNRSRNQKSGDQDFIPVSWRGGSNTAGIVYYGRLEGKHVILWPDNDEAGTKAMAEAGRQLEDLCVASLKIVDPRHFYHQ